MIYHTGPSVFTKRTFLFEPPQKWGGTNHDCKNSPYAIHMVFQALPKGATDDTEVGSAFEDKWPQASDQIRRTLSCSDRRRLKCSYSIYSVAWKRMCIYSVHNIVWH